MLENQILHNQFLDSFDQIFDLIHSYIYKEAKPNAINQKAAQKPHYQTQAFLQKIPNLKTYLQVDSSHKTHSIAFLGHQATYLDQEHSP